MQNDNETPINMISGEDKLEKNIGQEAKDADVLQETAPKDEMASIETAPSEDSSETGNTASVVGEEKALKPKEIVASSEFTAPEKQYNSKGAPIQIPLKHTSSTPGIVGKSLSVRRKKEDPLFNRHNLLLFAVVTLIFAIIIIIFRFVIYRETDPSHQIITFRRSSPSLKPIAAGGRSEGKIAFVSDVPGQKIMPCLEYSYSNEVDKWMGIVSIRPEMKNFKEIRFRIRSEKDRTFALSVEEITGAIYMFIFDLKGGEWREISATPSQFVQSADSRDRNSRMDLDELNNKIIIADMSGDKGIIGPNKFWIERLEIIK